MFRLLHEPFVLTPLMSGDGLMRGGSQPLHGSADSIALPKNGRPGDQHVGSCADDQGRRRRVDAAVNFEVAAGLKLIDHLADMPNLGQRRVYETLMAKAWVDRHD